MPVIWNNLEKRLPKILLDIGMNPAVDCCGWYSMWLSRIYSSGNGDAIGEKLLCGEQLLICNNGMYSDTEMQSAQSE